MTAFSYVKGCLFRSLVQAGVLTICAFAALICVHKAASRYETDGHEYQEKCGWHAT